MKARQENLKQQIQEVKRSLAQDKAPSQKSGLTSVFLESTQMLHIRHAAEHIKRQSNWSDKQEGYNKHLLDEFAKHKKRFTDSAQKMISEGSEKENKKEFETATKQYQEALNILLDCQLHLTEKLGEKRRLKDKNTDERIQFLEKQYETAQEEVESFKKKIEEVSLTLVERHVTSPAKGEVLTLEKVIPQIKSQYKQAYDKAYGESGHGISSFWRWVKDLFQKSDRAQEINFLNAVSTHHGCNELIRAQAIGLVHAKIQSETFGSGSALGKILGNLSEGSVQSKNEKGDLKDFINANEDLQNAMPAGLQKYFAKHEDEYTVSKFFTTIK